MSLLFHIPPHKKKTPKEIIEAINSLRISDSSYAAFDLDNTLLLGDIGEAVFALLVKKKKIKNFGWKDYLSLIEKNKLLAYKHIINLMAGLKLSLLEQLTSKVINNKNISIALESFKIPLPKVNKEMKLILDLLKKKGIPVYIVTASNEVSARIICEAYFGISAQNIIGAEVAYNEKGVIISGAKEFPYGKGKVNILKKRFKNKPLITGGDSPGDRYLLDFTSNDGIRFWLGKDDFNSV